MARLGYERYGAQGGDWGAFVAPQLGRVDPDHVVGVHVNAATFGFIPFGPVDPEELASFTDAEKARLERLNTARPGPGTATSRSRPPGRRPWPTGSPTRRSGSWPGSWRSSRSGPTTPTCPRTPSTATSC